MKTNCLHLKILPVIFILLITGEAGALAQPTVYVDPSFQNGIAGANITVNINVDPIGYEIYGAEYSLHFDPDKLEALSQTKGEFLTQDGSTSFVVITRINNSAGLLEYAESRTVTNDGVTKEGVLSTIKFRIKEDALSGNTTLDLGNVILTNPTPISIPDVLDIDGIVDIQTNTPPVADCGSDKLRCENVGSHVQFNASASHDADGTIVSYKWEFGDGTTGTGAVPGHAYSAYRWNGTSYIPYIVNLTVTDNLGMTDTATRNVFIWIAGDASGDGKVNIIDATIIGRKWGSDDPCADLNNDGKVNIIDASIIGANWGRSA